MFHAEQQVLIKKATFTTNIHLSCRDQDTVWAHSTEKNLLSLFQDAKDNQNELTYTGHHRQALFFPNDIFLISVTQKITMNLGKLPYLDFSQDLNGVRGLNKRIEVFKILFSFKSTNIWVPSSASDSKLHGKVNSVIKYRPKFRAVYKLQMPVTKWEYTGKPLGDKSGLDRSTKQPFIEF